MTSHIIAFVENFYQRSCDEILEAVDSSPASLTTKKDDFLSLLTAQAESVQYQVLPDLSPGELRPIVGNSISDLAAGGIRLEPIVSAPSLSEEDARSFTLDVRSLLLYAHTVAIPNPFAPAITIAGTVGQPRTSFASSMTDTSFLFGLETLTRLGSLIGKDIVFLIATEPKLDATAIADIERSLDDLIPHIAIELAQKRIFTWSDQADLYLRARSLAERYLRQDLYVSALSGNRITRLLSCAAEKAALPALSAMRASSARENQDPWVIDELMRLRLQGPGRLKLSDIASIRDDDSFAVFRRDMAEAIKASASPYVEDSAYVRQTVIADEMRGAAERLGLNTRKSVFLSSTLGDAVSWAVGAVVGGSIAGWSGVIAGLAAKGATEVLRSGPPRSKRAMRAHYVELSQAPPKPKAKSARDRLLD